MYPSFVDFKGAGSNGTSRVLFFCGKEYKAHHTDWYIDDALELASHWKEEQRTFERIQHLRDWIRENFQHGHNIPYEHLRTLDQCAAFIDTVIHAEYEHADMSWEGMKEQYEADLNQNRKMFT